MEFLNKLCQTCRKPMNGGTYRASHVCPHCYFAHEGGKSKRRFTPVVAAPASPQVEEQVDEVYAEAAPAAAPSHESAAVAQTTVTPTTVALTTKTADEHTILESLEEVTAECVLNLKVTPDMIVDGKFVGTKSEKVRAALEQGKKHVLTQLRQKAQEQGANIVTDVAVKNAVKNADAQNVKIVVRATGVAAVVDAAETSEA
ncbi:MAG: heavy metal-binding domain-containing protein [Cellvibrionaceae bacterium]|nr:heavy metal-binding domain-containing protein [Cellvibrionaceae bacterium]